MSLSSLLGLLFVGLKLGHVIDWSWWWVLSPWWAGWAFGVVILTLAEGRRRRGARNPSWR